MYLSNPVNKKIFNGLFNLSYHKPIVFHKKIEHISLISSKLKTIPCFVMEQSSRNQIIFVALLLILCVTNFSRASDNKDNKLKDALRNNTNSKTNNNNKQNDDSNEDDNILKTESQKMLRQCGVERNESSSSNTDYNRYNNKNNGNYNNNNYRNGNSNRNSYNNKYEPNQGMNENQNGFYGNSRNNNNNNANRNNYNNFSGYNKGEDDNEGSNSNNDNEEWNSYRQVFNNYYGVSI